MYIITGISRGLGKAICQQLLDNGESVLGVGRSNSIKHPGLTFLTCDLGNIEEIDKLDFDLPNEPITLINNAGVLGNIGRISEQDKSDLENVLTVNTIAPVLLIQKVYKRVQNKDQFTLVNISSGAGVRPIPSWASYCASKAALNMISDTFYLEEVEKGNKVKVYSVAPGVIDTNMQTQIRSTAEEDFSAVQRFKDLKETGALFSTEQAAEKLIKLLHQPFVYQERFDLREL